MSSFILYDILFMILFGLFAFWILTQKRVVDAIEKTRLDGKVKKQINLFFLDSIECCFLASYAPKDTKIESLNRVISRVDLLKLLLQLAWDVRALDNKKFTHLGKLLSEVGKMLGGWKKNLQTKTPTSK